MQHYDLVVIFNLNSGCIILYKKATNKDLKNLITCKAIAGEEQNPLSFDSPGFKRILGAYYKNFTKKKKNKTL